MGLAKRQYYLLHIPTSQYVSHSYGRAFLEAQLIAMKKYQMQYPHSVWLYTFEGIRKQINQLHLWFNVEEFEIVEAKKDG